jgi:coniferyl-aldehyde dehydrogenase
MGISNRRDESKPSLSGGSVADIFRAQRAAFEKDRYPSVEKRIDRLQRLRNAIKAKRDVIIEAISRDFGHRSTEESRVAEIAGTCANLDYALANVKKWMRPRSRSTSIWFMPGKNVVVPQPVGVVGVMSPWNYPVNLAIAPLASALAAGNRAMVKMSELTPETTKVLQTLLGQALDTSEVAIIGGDVSVAAEFSSLPFGHLLFTGSTRVGRMVMQAAAANLTPVTLELGGKCPVVIADDYSMEEAARRILWGKTFNAGQTCVAPDYVMVPKGKTQLFADAICRSYDERFPEGAMGTSYSSIIDDRNFARLQGLLEDAMRGGARVRPAEVISSGHVNARKMPLTLVTGAALDSRVMQQEIFGPLLPIVEYQTLGEARDRINAGENPLGLYFFGKSSDARDGFLTDTLSGGAAVNDVMLQFLQVDLPFGGVGASGFGRYHGREGFETFSHLKPVFIQRGFGTFTGLKLLYPPYGPIARRLIGLMGG